MIFISRKSLKGKISQTKIRLSLALISKKLAKLRLKEIGFILQASNLVPYLTVRDQLRFLDIVAKRKTDHDKIRELLESLSVDHLARKYPADLSGGERQRVAIAKVLHGSSQLILADEPTASLDS